MVSNCNLDMSKFKGFAFVNNSEQDMAVIITNESAFPNEGILRSGEVLYCKVADIVEVVSLQWAMDLHLDYLKYEKSVTVGNLGGRDICKTCGQDKNLVRKSLILDKLIEVCSECGHIKDGSTIER